MTRFQLALRTDAAIKALREVERVADGTFEQEVKQMLERLRWHALILRRPVPAASDAIEPINP